MNQRYASGAWQVIYIYILYILYTDIFSKPGSQWCCHRVRLDQKLRIPEFGAFFWMREPRAAMKAQQKAMAVLYFFTFSMFERTKVSYPLVNKHRP